MGQEVMMKRLIGIAFVGAMLVGCAGSNRNTKMEDTTAQGTYVPPPAPPTEQQPNSTSDQNAAGVEQQSPPNPSPTNNP
jgi:hypothetical protein